MPVVAFSSQVYSTESWARKRRSRFNLARYIRSLARLSVRNDHTCGLFFAETGEIGIKAVAAAVKSNRQNRQEDGSDKVETAVALDKQGGTSMEEQPRRFADKTATAARENLERGTSATEGCD